MNRFNCETWSCRGESMVFAEGEQIDIFLDKNTGGGYVEVRGRGGHGEMLQEADLNDFMLQDLLVWLAERGHSFSAWQKAEI